MQSIRKLTREHKAREWVRSVQIHPKPSRRRMKAMRNKKRGIVFYDSLFQD